MLDSDREEDEVVASGPRLAASKELFFNSPVFGAVAGFWSGFVWDNSTADADELSTAVAFVGAFVTTAVAALEPPEAAEAVCQLVNS